MNKEETELRLYFYVIPDLGQSMAERHEEIVRNMSKIGGPFGWRDIPLPPAPERQKGDLSAGFIVRYPDKKVHGAGYYIIRDKRYVDNTASSDDHICVEFFPAQHTYDIGSLSRDHIPDLIKAITPYRMTAYLGYHASSFDDVHEEKLASLLKRGVDVDGRNNIFTLNVVQYWDRELCQRALGYGPDEVIRRLTGKVPLVRPLMDGVYTVFSDDPNLTFEEFCAYNDRLKPVLGLI